MQKQFEKKILKKLLKGSILLIIFGLTFIGNKKN